MQMRKSLHVTSREEWRDWLSKNHSSETEVWLIFYKQHTGRPGIPYDHAVEEALCFGWIDSIVKRLDDEKYAQKFTPRRHGSNWSASNKQRLSKLIREGRMTAAGWAVAGGPTAGAEAKRKTPKHDADIPSFVEGALRANAPAWKNFLKLTPSYRNNYVRWIMHAKKQETRERRLREAVSLLKQNKKLGLK